MQTNPIARIRNSLEQLQILADGGQLSADRVRAFRARCERDLKEVAEELEPDEHFDITLEGLQTLYVNGKPVRWRGRLAIVDGGRS